MAGKLRVMIIDDSLFFREFLSRSLANDPGLEIVGAFGDPVEAQTRIAQLSPDVITVDMEMPKMRGNDFLRAVLPKNPRVRAIVISALSKNVFDAMQAGAIDFVGKPNSRPGYDNDQFARDIVQKIHAAAAATPKMPVSQRAQQPVSSPPLFGHVNLNAVTPKSLIAIGASTGGTEAIIEVVKNLPANTPGVVIVQHMPPVFTQMYAERVDRVSKMQASEAKNGDRVERGRILIAPGGDKQMRVRSDGAGYFVHIMPGPKVSGHCPSVDVLFESVAESAGANAVGVILTGMGADGAKNLLKMRQAGAHTIGQDQASCVVYGMPMVAYNIGGVSEQLPLSKITDAVLRRFSR